MELNSFRLSNANANLKGWLLVCANLKYFSGWFRQKGIETHTNCCVLHLSIFILFLFLYSLKFGGKKSFLKFKKKIYLPFSNKLQQTIFLYSIEILILHPFLNSFPMDKHPIRENLFIYLFLFFLRNKHTNPHEGVLKKERNYLIWNDKIMG